MSPFIAPFSGYSSHKHRPKRGSDGAFLGWNLEEGSRKWSTRLYLPSEVVLEFPRAVGVSTFPSHRAQPAYLAANNEKTKQFRDLNFRLRRVFALAVSPPYPPECQSKCTYSYRTYSASLTERQRTPPSSPLQPLLSQSQCQGRWQGCMTAVLQHFSSMSMICPGICCWLVVFQVVIIQAVTTKAEMGSSL